jgi:hypothetical protein
MVAAFEEFLRSVFQERLSDLVGVSPVIEFSKLPEVTQTTSVFYSLEISMGRRGRGSRGRKVDRLPAISKSAGLIVAGRLDPAALADMNSNPNSETVGSLFRALAVSQIFEQVRSEFDLIWGKPEAVTFLPDKLDEIVQRRHVIAHTADALKITREQLSEAVRYLECLATVLDDELARVVGGFRVSAAP